MQPSVKHFGVPSPLLHAVRLIAKTIVKNKIKIIHNIDRNINEMFDAISKWLPLYLTGLIESYSCNKARNSRFSHTMFIAKGTSTIYGSFIPSNDTDAVYNYITDKVIVKKYENQYNELLKNSSNLMTIFTKINSDKYLSELLEVSSISENSSLLSSNLSFGTMPNKLLRKILKRNNVKNAEKIFRCHEIARNCFLNYIKKNTFSEYISIPSIAMVSEGKVKLNINNSFIDENLFYTESEFNEHLKNIHKLATLYPNYILKEIEPIPLQNIEIFCKHNSSVIVSKTDSPSISFKFDNPLMINAFEKYIENA